MQQPAGGAPARNAADPPRHRRRTSDIPRLICNRPPDFRFPGHRREDLDEADEFLMGPPEWNDPNYREPEERPPSPFYHTRNYLSFMTGRRHERPRPPPPPPLFGEGRGDRRIENHLRQRRNGLPDELIDTIERFRMELDWESPEDFIRPRRTIRLNDPNGQQHPPETSPAAASNDRRVENHTRNFGNPSQDLGREMTHVWLEHRNNRLREAESRAQPHNNQGSSRDDEAGPSRAFSPESDDGAPGPSNRLPEEHWGMDQPSSSRGHPENQENVVRRNNGPHNNNNGRNNGNRYPKKGAKNGPNQSSRHRQNVTANSFSIPSTSTAAPFDFEDVFERLSDILYSTDISLSQRYTQLSNLLSEGRVREECRAADYHSDGLQATVVTVNKLKKQKEIHLKGDVIKMLRNMVRNQLSPMAYVIWTEKILRTANNR